MLKTKKMRILFTIPLVVVLLSTLTFLVFGQRSIAEKAYAAINDLSTVQTGRIDNMNVSESTYTYGDYFQLGKYQDEPILWRFMDDSDENGMLLISDQILCYKAYDALLHQWDGGHFTCSGFWEESNIRAWLNSTAPAGAVVWPRNNPPNSKSLVLGPLYADEKGFLAEGNFTESELSIMKTVSQWNAAPEDQMEYSENGISIPIELSQSWDAGRDNPLVALRAFEELEYTYGAKYRLTDTVFLMDHMQMYRLMTNLGTLGAGSDTGEEQDIAVVSGSYWLRGFYTMGSEICSDTYEGFGLRAYYPSGIRPAFFLDSDTMVVLSGSGTKADPYVIDGPGQNGDIAVYCNGSQLTEFEQAPVLESDRVLVPMRAIFEAMDADIQWDSKTKTITAECEDTTITMQLNNPVMTVDGEEVTLDVAPYSTEVGRTLVPVRAISEALGAKVTWVGNLDRVVITNTPDESVNHPWEPLKRPNR